MKNVVQISDSEWEIMNLSKIAFALREDLPGEIGVLENFVPAEKLAAK